MTTPADHSFYFDPNTCACGERKECDHSCMPDVIDGFCSRCGKCLQWKERAEHAESVLAEQDSPRAVERERATDEMVERAWAAIVGFDVAGQCFVCSLTRADLRVGITAALAFENGKPSVGAQVEGVATVNSEAREPVSKEQWTIEKEYRTLLEAINHRLLADGCIDVHTPLHRRLCRTLALTSQDRA